MHLIRIQQLAIYRIHESNAIMLHCLRIHHILEIRQCYYILISTLLPSKQSTFLKPSNLLAVVDRIVVIAIIAIVLMLLSKRYKNRPLWLAGFGLLILVVLKLFFVELANSGTIERIISFIVVGSLLLLIGYFVPLPPDEEKNEEQKGVI